MDYDKLMLDIRISTLEMYLCENKKFKEKYINHLKTIIDLVIHSGNDPDTVLKISELFESQLRKIESYQTL